MMNIFIQTVSITGYMVETVGVIIILIGAIRATIRSTSRFSKENGEEAYRQFRHEFGRAMMLGLEFLIAGDIIRTVIVAHSITDILSLGLLVLIRTVLVFTIHLELEGHWPWQVAPAKAPPTSDHKL